MTQRYGVGREEGGGFRMGESQAHCIKAARTAAHRRKDPGVKRNG